MSSIFISKDTSSGENTIENFMSTFVHKYIHVYNRQPLE